MDYDTNDFPIERNPDEAPSQHFTYADGVSRAKVNGPTYQAIRRENLRRTQAAKHSRQSHTA